MAAKKKSPDLISDLTKQLEKTKTQLRKTLENNVKSADKAVVSLVKKVDSAKKKAVTLKGKLQKIAVAKTAAQKARKEKAKQDIEAHKLLLNTLNAELVQAKSTLKVKKEASDYG